MANILVTGGLGFMGSSFVRYALEKWPEDRIIILDALTYAGRRENIAGIEDKVDLVIDDLKNWTIMSKLVSKADVVFHFAAQTHIDRSIVDPVPFVESNIIGTFNLLEVSRRSNIEKFVYVSSSEIYGTAVRIPMEEDHPLNPQSPYAATKLSGDRMCYAYHMTYGLPVTIIRAFNNYGPRQFPEKLIPYFTIRALHNLRLPVYGDGKYSRDYLYVFDFCEALARTREARCNGEAINVSTGRDIDVISIARMILKHLGKSEELISHVADRPGHVRRLVGDRKKAKQLLDWEPKTKFEDGIAKTIDWYEDNSWWWKPLSRNISELQEHKSRSTG